MATEPVLLFRDEAAFTSTVRALGLRDPVLLEQDYELLYVQHGSEPLQPVLRLAGAAESLAPSEGRSERINAAIDLARSSMTVKTGRVLGRKKYQIRSRREGANLALLCRLAPWRREPPLGRILFCLPDEESLALVAIEHFELGRDQLRFAIATDGESRRPLLDVTTRASFHLVQKWAEKKSSRPLVYYEGEAPGVLLPWGYEHPFAAWIPEDRSSDQQTLFELDGRRWTVPEAAFREIGELLDYGTLAEGAKPWEGSAEERRIELPLRLTGRVAPADPQLWVLPVERQEELEWVLEVTPEEELKNLLLARFAKPDGSEVYLIREVISGRTPRLLPESGLACAPLNRSLPNLLLPRASTLAPSLSPHRYSRAFDLQPGELTLVEAGPGNDPAALVVSKLSEAAFRPLSQLVDFIVHEEHQRLAECILSTPFELGEFAELDLVDPRGAASGASSKSSGAKPSDPAPEKAPEDSGLIDRVKSLFKVGRKPVAPEPESESESALPALSVDDPARRALEERLTEGAGSIADWYRLGESLIAEGEVGDGVRCVESGLWLAGLGEGLEEEAEGEARLRELFGAAEGRPASVAELYGALLSFVVEAPELGREAVAERSAFLQRQLLELSPVLRKKTRWLLWRALLQVTGDGLQEARQREDLLALLALKGVEDREVHPFVRCRMLASARLAGNSGSGGARALSFLREARGMVESLERGPHRGVALAVLGKAHVQLGASDRALELAQEAEQGLRIESPEEAICMIRIAALRERAGQPPQDEVFRKALAVVAQEQSFRHRKALVEWFSALAEARSTQGGAEELVASGLAQLSTHSPRHQSWMLSGVVGALVRLGAAEPALEKVRGLMVLPPEQFYLVDPRGELAELHVYENLGKTLAELTGDAPTKQHDAERIIAVLRALPTQITDLSIELALVAFRCDEEDMLVPGEALAAGLSGEQGGFAALNLQVAILRRLAELGQRELGRSRLRDLLEESRAHRCSAADCDPFERDYHRGRLVLALIELVPAFFPAEQGAELVSEASSFAVEMRSAYMRSLLLSACARSLSQLGRRGPSMQSLESYVDFIAKEFERDRRGVRYGSNFEVLASCAEGAAQVGDLRRGTALVGRIVGLAEAGLDRMSASSWRLEEFDVHRSLIAAGRALHMLGNSEAAERALLRVLEGIEEGFANFMDRIEIARWLEQAVSELSSARRFEMTERVLQAVFVVCDGSLDCAQDMLVEFVAEVVEDVVLGESAFATALKRWKGEEERAIRERLNRDRICE